MENEEAKVGGVDFSGGLSAFWTYRFQTTIPIRYL